MSKKIAEILSGTYQQLSPQERLLADWQLGWMVKRLPHQVKSDPTYVDEMTWAAPGKPSVVLYAVHGGGHVIPQKTMQFWGSLGRQTEDLDAPAAIWDFFSKAAPRN